jgi:histidine ammonia-lyase
MRSSASQGFADIGVTMGLGKQLRAHIHAKTVERLQRNL